MTTSDITILGLGPMGRALAGTLLDSGRAVTVFNRSPDRARPLEARGATLAPDPATAVAASPLSIACVVDNAAVRALVEPAAIELAGRTLVNLTADTPASARELAAWATDAGASYLDGAIMTPAYTIGTDAALILYSGSDDAFATHRSTLAPLAPTQTFLGDDPGRAAAHDVALLDMFWTGMSGLVHGFALAAAEGVPAAALAEYARGIAGLLPDMSETIADALERDDHSTDVSALSSAVAGMGHIVAAAGERSMNADVIAAAHRVAQRAAEDGDATAGFSVLATRYLEGARAVT